MEHSTKLKDILVKISYNSASKFLLFTRGADSVSAKKVLQALVLQISSPYILISECYTGSKKAESNFIRSQSQNSGLSRDSKHRSARSHSLATATTSKILNKSFQGTII